MNWINEVLNRAGQPFRNVLDSLKNDVYEHCNSLLDEGATVREAYSITYGMYEELTKGNVFHMLYLDYVNDWYNENTEDEDDD